MVQHRHTHTQLLQQAARAYLWEEQSSVSVRDTAIHIPVGRQAYSSYRNSLRSAMHASLEFSHVYTKVHLIKSDQVQTTHILCRVSSQVY